MNYLLDTNIITAILKNNKTVLKKIKAVELVGDQIFLSTISYYEITRGLLAVKATRQMKRFDQLCIDYDMLGTDSKKVLNKAADIYAYLKIRGEIIQDADILIAAVALANDLTLVTADQHFDRIPTLRIENWRKY